MHLTAIVLYTLSISEVLYCMCYCLRLCTEAGNCVCFAVKVTDTTTASFAKCTLLLLHCSLQVRRTARLEERAVPHHMIGGLGSGGMSLVTGITDGVQGMLMNPIRYDT
eukprot:5511-Heterococcus_DN1.PRE.1